jgi:hypothetical protein
MLEDGVNPYLLPVFAHTMTFLSREKLMKINNESDGEYTDSESAVGSSGAVKGDAPTEGEYTDSDTPDDDSADTGRDSS